MGSDFPKMYRIMGDVSLFPELTRIHLRSYQLAVARSIAASVLGKLGLSFVVVFPRQSGKNELQAQIEAYFLLLYSLSKADMVKVSPTMKPQSQNAMRRLEHILSKNIFTKSLWCKKAGYIYQIGTSSVQFISASPTSSIVGATASLLLECDEAQDVEIGKWDKEIAPMAASTNATRIFWGTAWTSRTLLARELRAARIAEEGDHVQRTWVMDANKVGSEVPAYRKFVAEQVARLGRNNPLVRTQYFSEEIDAEGGMFPLSRRVLMLGAHERNDYPTPGAAYVFTIDVAGEDEGAFEVGTSRDLPLLDNPRRDSTVVTIFEIVPPAKQDIQRKPVYKVVSRISWQGVKHSALYTTIIAMTNAWQPVKMIIDATGVGAGLASFLADKFGTKVLPFEFSPTSKSDLGWSFISVIESGRYKEYQPIDKVMSTQLEYCQYTIVEGPGKLMRWAVPDGTRDISTGKLVHDDYVLSAALISLLDQETWGTGDSQIVEQPDILKELTF